MWNLFKAQLIAEYTPTTYNFADLNKVGKHGRYTEQLYRRHFDITSGGRILPRPDVPIFFESMSVLYCGQNRFNLNTTNKLLSSQLGIDHTYYWTGRIIDSPIATIFTVFPGVWLDIGFSANFFASSRKWINDVALNMYLQKMMVLGVRISKAPPYLITPWSGYLYQTLDGAPSLGAILDPIKNNFNLTLDALGVIVYQGNLSLMDPIKQAYNSVLDSIFTPELFDVCQSIPSAYGFDFNNANSTIGASNSDVQDYILGATEKAFNDFIEAYLAALPSTSGGGYGGVSLSGKFGNRRIIFLIGTLGTEGLRSEYIIRRFRRDDKRFTSKEEADDNLYILNLFNRTKEEKRPVGDLGIFYYKNQKLFSEIDRSRVYTYANTKALEEERELRLNTGSFFFPYYTTDKEDTPVVISDVFPEWYENYIYSFNSIPLNFYRRSIFNDQYVELDREYDLYRSYTGEEKDWSGTSNETSGSNLLSNVGSTSLESYITNIDYERELEAIVDKITYLLYDVDRFSQKDIIVDSRILKVEDMEYVLYLLREKLGLKEDEKIYPFVKLFSDPNSFDLTRIAYRRVLDDPCGPLTDGPALPQSSDECHFKSNENIFIALLSDCDDSAEISSYARNESFESFRNKYYREIFNYNNYDDSSDSCKKYIIATKSRSSISFEYFSCSGRLLRNNITATSRQPVSYRILCSSKRPRIRFENEAGGLSFCNTCFSESDPQNTISGQYNTRKISINQLRDTLGLQNNAYKEISGSLNSLNMFKIKDEFEFLYLRKE